MECFGSRQPRKNDTKSWPLWIHVCKKGIFVEWMKMNYFFTVCLMCVLFSFQKDAASFWGAWYSILNKFNRWRTKESKCPCLHCLHSLLTLWDIPSLLSQDGRPEQRNANDSDALAAKVAMKAEMKKKQEEEEANAVSNAPVVRKKKKKEVDSLDDLFSAALTVKGRKK